MKIIEKLEKRAKKVGTVLCLGLDPVPSRMPIKEGSEVQTTKVFLTKIVKELGEKVAAVKPNSAFFEQLGAKGIQLLVEICQLAKDMDIPVILDAKRGDIGSTAKAYARYVFDVIGADMVTLSPYLGEDSLVPFFDRMKDGSKGCYLLNRTSNPGGARFQNLVVDGRPLYEHVTDSIIEWNAKFAGSIGAVVGATVPTEFDAITKIYCEKEARVPLLVPGVGAQGGDANRVLEILRERSLLLRARVNSSSGILYAHEKSEEKDWLKASANEIERLRKILPA